MAVSVYTGASSSDIVYVNYTGDTPTNENITNIKQVLEAYTDGKMIAIQYAPKTLHTSYVQKSPFILSYARKYGMPDRWNYIFDFVSEFIEVDVTTGNAISCPYCITLDFSEVVSEGSSLPVGTIVINGVTDRGLAKPMPSAHAYTHKTGGDDAIAPSDIGAQPKITANGILKGDGTGTITAADETEVELVDLPQEVFWATYNETSYAEIKAAYDAKKVIFVKDNLNNIYSLNAFRDNEFVFCNVINFPNDSYTSQIMICSCSSSGWIDRWANYFSIGFAVITLPAASWTGSDPYTQIITIPQGKRGTQANIQLSDTLYDQLVADGVIYLNIENDNGTFIVKAKGGKPSVDLTVQVSLLYGGAVTLPDQ